MHACLYGALCLVWFAVFFILIICRTAIAYSIGHIINSVWLCLCVFLSVCLSALSRSHFFIDFRQTWLRGNNPKSKNEFAVGQSRTIASPILPQTPNVGAWIGVFKPKSQNIKTCVLWPPILMDRPLYFRPVVSSIFCYLSFFLTIISAIADWISAIVPHMVWP